MECPNCQQYHLEVQPTTPTPLSYRSFSSQLKDRFGKKSKAESKLSKLTLPSNTPPFPESLLKTAAREKKSIATGASSALTVKKEPVRNRTVSIFDKKMQRILEKNKLHKLKKCCIHYKETKADSFNQNIYNSLQVRSQHSSEMERESLFLEEELMVMKETPFRKPFNSIKLKDNPRVYDTLLDNRCCGMNFCEDQGEMVLTPQFRKELLMKMKMKF